MISNSMQCPQVKCRHCHRELPMTEVRQHQQLCPEISSSYSLDGLVLLSYKIDGVWSRRLKFDYTVVLSYGPQIAIYKYCGYTNNNCIIHFSILLTIKLTCLFSHSFLNMDEDDDDDLDDLVRNSTVFYWTEVKIIYINSYSIIGRGYFSGVKSIWLTTFCIPLVSIYTCKNLTSL